MELRGSMVQTASGLDGNNFNARSEHIVRFTGSSTDTFRLHWDTPSGAPSQFRRLEVLTRGGPGLRMYGAGELSVVRASQLEIGTDATFIIPTGRYTFGTTGLSPNGVYLQQGAQLVRNGTLSVNGATVLTSPGCASILGLDVLQPITGLLSCVSPTQ
jgi:hypothetical protein